jgi:hypothetical protein
MSDECVTVVQGKECKYLTFLCPQCNERHTIPVIETKVGWYIHRYEPSDRTSGYTVAEFTGRDANNQYVDVPSLPYIFWYWNGDLVKPVLGPQCHNAAK